MLLMKFFVTIYVFGVCAFIISLNAKQYNLQLLKKHEIS